MPIGGKKERHQLPSLRNIGIAICAGKIPLEMAVKPGSLFPKHLLYLLAPSYQAGLPVPLGHRV